MRLAPSPFAMIKAGRKTIELRLYDEKRRGIRVGDTVVFSNTAAPEERIQAEVTALYVYDSFESLYKELPLLKCGYTECDVHKASPKDMEKYYSMEEQREHGVLGIEIRMIKA